MTALTIRQTTHPAHGYSECVDDYRATMGISVLFDVYSAYMSGASDLSGIKAIRQFADRRITADYLAEALRDAINRGDLSDGAVLNQAQIATHFGVSRVPVREAMRQLQAEGLVDSQAHRLAVVRGLDIDSLIEVYTLRSVIEGWLIEQAVPRIDEETLLAAKSLNEELKDETDHAAWLDLNAKFHRTLYEPSGALMTLELLGQLRSRAERYARMWSRGTGIHRPAETSREHDDILDFIATGDAAGARAAIEQHVLHTRDRMVEYGIAHASIRQSEQT